MNTWEGRAPAAGGPEHCEEARRSEIIDDSEVTVIITLLDGIFVARLTRLPTQDSNFGLCLYYF